MQAASGGYKPLRLVDKSSTDEPMETDMEEHSEISAEQSDVLFSLVCYIYYYFHVIWLNSLLLVIDEILKAIVLLHLNAATLGNYCMRLQRS